MNNIEILNHLIDDLDATFVSPKILQYVFLDIPDFVLFKKEIEIKIKNLILKQGDIGIILEGAPVNYISLQYGAYQLCFLESTKNSPLWEDAKIRMKRNERD